MRAFKLKDLFIATLLTTFLACSEEEPIIEYVTVIETVTESVQTVVEVNPYADATL